MTDQVDEKRFHLGQDLDVSLVNVTSAYWAHESNTSPELSQGRILSVFDYTTTWPYWERHPAGDELLYLLSGDVELVLDDDVVTSRVRLGAGEAAIVPAGTWHRAMIHAASRILFVTPTPSQTQQRPAA